MTGVANYGLNGNLRIFRSKQKGGFGISKRYYFVIQPVWGWLGPATATIGSEADRRVWPF